MNQTQPNNNFVWFVFFIFFSGGLGLVRGYIKRKHLQKMNQTQPNNNFVWFVFFIFFLRMKILQSLTEYNPILAECLRAVLENPEQDDLAGEIKEIEEVIKANIPDLSLLQLRERVCDVAIGAVIIQYRNVGSFKLLCLYY